MCHVAGCNDFLFLFFLSLIATHHIRRLLERKKLDKNTLNILLPVVFISIYIAYYHAGRVMHLGIIAGIVAGIAGSFYNTSSKYFALQSGLGPNDVLAVRYYMIIFFCSFFIKNSMLFAVSLRDLLELIFISLFTLILPLYMNQRSLMQLSIDKHTMIISATPLMAYVFQGLFLQEWSLLLLMLSIVTFLICVCLG